MYSEQEYGTVTIEGAFIPERPDTSEEIGRNDELLRKSKNRFVFFAGNVIDTLFALSKPYTAFGGVYLPHIRCLNNKVNRGMVYQCEITALKPRMTGINRNFLAPGDRDGWEESYTLKNGVFNPSSGWEDVLITDPLKVLVYKRKALPGNDVRKITRPFGQFGVSGVVEITALAGKTEREAQELQLFYFPDWSEIKKGKIRLPQTVKGLGNHLKTRLSEAVILGDSVLIQTGREMLKSVTLYQQWGAAFLKRIEGSMNTAKQHGIPYEYPYLGEIVLSQLEQQRKDDLAQAGANSQAELVGALTAQNTLKQAELELEKEKLALEREKLELEKLRLGEQKNVMAFPSNAVCADFNARGEACKAKVVRQDEEGQFYCASHPKAGV